MDALDKGGAGGYGNGDEHEEGSGSIMFRLGEYTFFAARTPAQRREARRLVEERRRSRRRVNGEEDWPEGYEEDAEQLDLVPGIAPSRRGDTVGTAQLLLKHPLGLPALRLASPGKRGRFKGHARPAQVTGVAIAEGCPGGVWDLRGVARHLGGAGGRPPGAGISPTAVVFAGLLEAAFQAGQARGVTDYLVACSRAAWKFLGRYGLPLLPLGAAGGGGARAAFSARASELVGPLDLLRRFAVTALASQTHPPACFGERAKAGSLHMAGVRFTAGAGEDRAREACRLRGEGPDAYDPWAVQVLASNRQGKLLGAARLALHSPLGFESLQSAAQEARWELSSSQKIGEVSRLVLAAPYDQAFTERAFSLRPRERRLAQILLIGLLRMLYRASKGARLSSWCFLADKDSVRFFARHGLSLHRVGGVAASRERWAPHVLRFHEVEKNLHSLARLRALARDMIYRPVGSPLFRPGGRY